MENQKLLPQITNSRVIEIFANALYLCSCVNAIHENHRSKLTKDEIHFALVDYLLLEGIKQSIKNITL